MKSSTPLKTGWAAADITPDRPALLGGITRARISEKVMDPLYAVALALESAGADGTITAVILIGCDLRGIREEIRDGVRARLRKILPEVDAMHVILNGTHTHTAPPLGNFGIELDGMNEDEYRDFAVPRIAEAARQAWSARQPGGISYGLTHAVVGRNRQISFADGHTKMYGNTADPEFSHVEGYEDHSVNLLCTWDAGARLTGMIVNVACPSQVSQSLSVLSADFWHETRNELRRRWGPDLFVLPQCSAAGDQSPTVLWDKRAAERMLQLSGRDQRQEIAVRLADAVSAIMPVMRQNIEKQPLLRHAVSTLKLPLRPISADDLAQALADARPHQDRFEQMQAELRANPRVREQPDWLCEITRAFWHARRGRTVQERYDTQARQSWHPAEVHVVRLGEMAMATNPFELYLDHGIRIKARSPAVQTFISQLTNGSGGYVPTLRALSGGAYGAVPASNRVGPDGGRELVEQTLVMLTNLWET